MKVFAFYSQIEVEGRQLAGKVGQDNWYLGAAAPFGQWSFKASWGQADGTGLRSAIGAKQWGLTLGRLSQCNAAVSWAVRAWRPAAPGCDILCHTNWSSR